MNVTERFGLILMGAGAGFALGVQTLAPTLVGYAVAFIGWGLVLAFGELRS